MKNILLSLKKVYFLTKGQRTYILIILFLVFFMPLLEVFGISMVAPLAALSIGEEFKELGLINKFIELLPFNFADFNSTASLIIFVILLRVCMSFYLSFLRAKLSVNLRIKWTKKILQGIVYGDYMQYINERSGELIETISSEITLASKAIYRLIQLVEKLSYAVLLFLALLITNAYFTLVITFALVFILCLMRVMGITKTYKRGQKLVKYEQLITIKSSDILSNVRQIKLLNTHSRSLNKVLETLNKFSKVKISAELWNVVPKNFIETFITILLIIGLIYSYNSESIDIKNSLPNIAVITLLGGRLANIFESMTKKYLDVSIIFANLDSVFNRIFRKNKKENIKTGIELVDIKDEIKFANVSFTYPGSEKKSLKNINLVFKKGLNLIIGPSGCGKSTLLELILGLYAYDKGEIYFDGICSKKYNLMSIRSTISYATQEDELIYGTVYENILYGAPDKKFEDVIRASKFAQAHQFIEKLPEKYNTIISEKGNSLSGGQRQRICLARTLLRRKSVYIFDEITNSLDDKTSKEVQKIINKISSNAIVIQISHLIDDEINANRIYEFDFSGRLKIVN